MGRIPAFVYGLSCYAAFVATFLYAMGFVSNVGVPLSAERLAGLGAAGERAPPRRLRRSAQRHGAAGVQEGVDADRADPGGAQHTYVLFSSLALLLLFWGWEPIGGVVWEVTTPAARVALIALSLAGWLLVLLSTVLINHFDLFGLRQVYFYLRGRDYKPIPFRTPVIYNYVRHPLYLGFLVAFWAAPTMTIAHLVFALATTGYILIAIRLEERDLLREHPSYGAYRTLRCLRAYPFPGNVRELENEIERAVALADDGRPLGVEHLSERLRASATAGAPGAPVTLNEAIEQLKRRMIEDAMRECGSKTRAAERLGLTRQSLQQTLSRRG
jgi:protein-S-isoprenylcysteine O-methyltransferase Ste14